MHQSARVLTDPRSHGWPSSDARSAARDSNTVSNPDYCWTQKSVCTTLFGLFLLQSSSPATMGIKHVRCVSTHSIRCFRTSHVVHTFPMPLLRPLFTVRPTVLSLPILLLLVLRRLENSLQSSFAAVVSVQISPRRSPRRRCASRVRTHTRLPYTCPTSVARQELQMSRIHVCAVLRPSPT